MSETPSIEWLAGFFEGEGCIAAQKMTKELSCGVSQTRIQVKVRTTNKAEPEQFEQFFGRGSCRKEREAEPEENTAAQWEWRVSGRNVVEILAQLLPELYGPKKKQAQIAIKHGNLVKQFNGKEVPERAAERRVNMVRKIQSLTQQGGFDV